MVSDGFFQGYMTQSVANANHEVERANIKIAELRDLRRQDTERIEQQERALAERDQAIVDLRAEMDMRRAHYFGLGAERDYLLELLDDIHGPEKNPARKLAYSDESFVIESGPRKGQRPEARDDVFFTAMANAVKEKFAYLGSWRKLLRENRLFD